MHGIAMRLYTKLKANVHVYIVRGCKITTSIGDRYNTDRIVKFTQDRCWLTHDRKMLGLIQADSKKFDRSHDTFRSL